MGDIFRCESFTDLPCISNTLTTILKSPTPPTASEEEIMAFVSTLNAACLRLLKNNCEGTKNLFMEATRAELQFFTSADASVQTALSQEMYSFYSQVPTTVSATHSPHPQSVSTVIARMLVGHLVHTLSDKQKPVVVTQPLLHTLAGGATLVARGRPDTLSLVFGLLFGLHANSTLVSCA